MKIKMLFAALLLMSCYLVIGTFDCISVTPMEMAVEK